MNANICMENIVSYMQNYGFIKLENSEYIQVLKSQFPNNYKECYLNLQKQYWNVDSIISAINDKFAGTKMHNSAYEKVESDKNTIQWPYVEKEEDYIEDNFQTGYQTNTGQIKQTQSFFTYPNWTFWYIIWIILVIIIIIMLWKLIKYIFSFLYDVFNVHRLVYMKIVMPRLDTKIDRDIQKDLAKDMKEQTWRMAQVFRWVHKIWWLSVWDNIMSFLFDKAKIDLIYKYKNWEIYFIVWTYPEYQKTLEANISAQYSEAIIETIDKFDILGIKKYIDIIPLNLIKNSVFPLRTFRQLEDDPINNILDTISKISQEDEISILITLRPNSKNFNKEAKIMADKLYKREVKYDQKFELINLIKPINFLINGPSDQMIKRMKPWAEHGDAYTRMTKAEEEAINTMADEAWKPAFSASMFIISWSDKKENNSMNIQSLVSSYAIYKDEYNNALDQPEIQADLFWWFFKPLWKMSAIFLLIGFFVKTNIFTINELASLFHFPMAVFNRASAIVWAEYKMSEPPKNLPIPNQENGMVLNWILAEKYKLWDISKIFEWSKHPNIWKKVVEKIEKDEKTWEEKIIKEEKTWIKLYKDAILLGISVYKNQYKPVFIKRKDRTRHHYIIWKSGWGKSVYIWTLARQDIWNGDWVCVIDPHGDLIEDIINYVPKERAKDVIYFDAWNEERPMWLNLYEIRSKDETDRVVNDATEIFLKMFWPEIFWPRIQEYFKYGSLTLLEDMEEWATLLDIPRLFTDEWYREYKVSKVTNPTVRNFWEKTYNAMWEREKQEIIPYFTSKFVSFNTNSLIRNIIWQTKSAFNFRESMDSKKIILINLSKGKIWEINAQLLWMIVVSQIYNAAMSRADIPEEERKDFYLYVDEFQNFVSWTFADILSEARKYHLSLIMAHQYIAQLEWSGQSLWDSWKWKSSVKDAVFGNVWTIQSFKVWAPDAEFLEKEYTPVLSPQDIIWISNYKTYIKLNIDNATSRVFNLSTIYSQDYKNKRVWDIIKEYSSKKYGRNVKFVNEEIIARLWFADVDEE